MPKEKEDATQNTKHVPVSGKLLTLPSLGLGLGLELGLELTQTLWSGR